MERLYRDLSGHDYFLFLIAQNADQNGDN